MRAQHADATRLLAAACRAALQRAGGVVAMATLRVDDTGAAEVWPVLNPAKLRSWGRVAGPRPVHG